MPFAQTWSEELIAEWLQMKGYLVEIGLPAGTHERGGRYEADVIGVKIVKNSMELLHIEIGMLAGGGKSIESIKKKFKAEYCENIKKYFREKLSFNGKINYKKMYVASYSNKPVAKAARNMGIEFIELPNFIKNQVLPTIKNWKEHPPHKPKTTGKHIQLPGGQWLLQLFDYLIQNGLLKE